MDYFLYKTDLVKKRTLYKKKMLLYKTFFDAT